MRGIRSVALWYFNKPSAKLSSVVADNSLTILDAPIALQESTEVKHSLLQNDTDALPVALPSPIQRQQQRALLHASLLTASEPLSSAALQGILELSASELQAALDDLSRVLREQHLGVMLEAVAQGYRLVIEPQIGQNLAPLMKKRSRSGLSQASLETLALIAYHQPVTRSHLEQVRGASCSSTLETLQEHALISVVGHSDSLGKPRLYGTTQAFLLEFGLQSLDDLPALETPQAFVRS